MTLEEECEPAQIQFLQEFLSLGVCLCGPLMTKIPLLQ